MLLISFYTPWKHQKTEGFLMFSGGIETDRGMKWVNSPLNFFESDPFIIYKIFNLK